MPNSWRDDSYKRKDLVIKLADGLQQELMDLDQVAKPLCTCKRKHVGVSAVRITPKGEVLRMYFAVNGPTERHGKDWCNGIKGACGCPHAEPKLMFSLAHHYCRIGDVADFVFCDMYSPCTNCANVMLSGQPTIRRLVYDILTEHDKRGLEILQNAGVQCIQRNHLVDIALKTHSELQIQSPEIGKIYDTLDLWIP